MPNKWDDLKTRLQSLSDMVKAKNTDHPSGITINLELDDAVIMATDRDGTETSRLAIEIGGKTLKVWFPLANQWDQYCHALSDLYLALGEFLPATEVLDYFEPDLSQEKWVTWTHLMSGALVTRRVQRRLWRVLWFCRPAIDGFKDTWLGRRKLLKFISQNMGIDQLLRLYIAISQPEQFIKKNATSLLKNLYPTLAPQLYIPSSKKSTQTQSADSKQSQSSLLDFS